MKLEYYYETNKNAKSSLRGGFILAIILTVIFIISRNNRIEYIGLFSFIIECTAFFLLLFSVYSAVALINYIINSIRRSKDKSVRELGQMCTAYITGATRKKDYLSTFTGATTICELSITHEADLFRVTGLTLNDGFLFLLKHTEELESYPIPVRAYIKGRQIYVDLTTAKLDENHFNNTTNILYDLIDNY